MVTLRSGLSEAIHTHLRQPEKQTGCYIIIQFVQSILDFQSGKCQLKCQLSFRTYHIEFEKVIRIT